MSRSFGSAHLFVPAVVALGLRLANLAYVAARDPLFMSPVVDSWLHVRRAYQVLDLGILLPGIQAFYKGPLYTYVLAALFAVFGPTRGLVAAYLFSVLCGAVTVGLIALVASRLGGHRAAWIAGMVAAAYGVAVHFDTTLLLVPLVTLLLVATGERLVSARDSADPTRALIAAGVLLGLASITRANAVLAVAAAGAWAAWAARGGRWVPTGSGRAAALVLVPALVVIAPVTARNVILERDPVLISWNGGINLFMGNDPAFDQTSGNWHPDLTWTRLYDAPFDLGLFRGADHQRFFVRQSASRFVDDPVTASRILARKAVLFASAYEISNNRRLDSARTRSPVLRFLTPRFGPLIFPFVLVVPLLGAAMVLMDRSRLSRSAPLLVLAGAWALAPILFFNTSRYRLPMILLLIPAAAAVASGSNAMPSMKRLALAATAWLVMLVTAVATVPSRPALPPPDEFFLALVASREGRSNDALTILAAAAESDSADPFVRMRLAESLRFEGRCSSAIALYRSFLDRRGLAADWRNAAIRNQARCHVTEGRLIEAERGYLRFLDTNPDRPVTDGRPDFHLKDTPPLRACLARLELADMLWRVERTTDAATQIKQVAQLCSESPPLTQVSLAMEAEMHGREQEATRLYGELLEIVELSPELRGRIESRLTALTRLRRQPAR